jgi:hypothetical protein
MKTIVSVFLLFCPLCKKQGVSKLDQVHGCIVIGNTVYCNKCPKDKNRCANISLLIEDDMQSQHKKIACSECQKNIHNQFNNVQAIISQCDHCGATYNCKDATSGHPKNCSNCTIDCIRDPSSTEISGGTCTQTCLNKSYD